jgi:protein tyrosine/serine phosphatase
MKLVKSLFCIALCALCVIQIAWAKPEANSKPRNPRWAEAVSVDGVPNLHQVSKFLYRSGQPQAKGFKALENLGVRSVINLRTAHSDVDLLKGTNLRYTNIKMDARNLKQDDIISILKILQRKEEGPFLVHCHRGADRTGLIVALYRIVFQGWSKEAAINEMKNGGYGYFEGLQSLETYIKAVDLKELREKLE